ncbi:MAG: TatD family deoxyribonuclease [Candidatus Omnitrophota bacterium]|jgi:TatD DNase family protein|nr:MAG: TatD family deoxyribonuclease [Candidatus Omnitrophota bacterium]
MFVDTHCHLDFPEFDSDRESVIKNAVKKGVLTMINIGSDILSSQNSVSLADTYGCIYASVGIHPHDADSFDSTGLEAIKKLAVCKKVVAIGEIGLDYFKNYSSQDAQKKMFVELGVLAAQLQLPVVVHCRNAEEDTLSIIRDIKPAKAVIHCFSGDEQFLKECLDLGLFISFTCNITYKKADKLRAVVKLSPLNRVMLETDAPYLAPEGYRGRRNDPAHISTLVAEMARIKDLSIEEVASVTTANAKSFFGLK